MISISGCLIVKNEEDILARCLDSMMPVLDELIIVDTGSTDETKEIAAKYTDKIYDFEWVDDFSKARNFAFSKCTKDYIFSIDADEVLGEKAQADFLWMKQVMLDEVEIVQMYYVNQLKYNTVYNFDREYRPKLFKRIREFRWENPIHESVINMPVVYDSDIEIFHLPEALHTKRDFHCYYRALDRGDKLPEKLWIMWCKELFISGENQDFIISKEHFLEHMEQDDLSENELRSCQCVLARAARLTNNLPLFLSMCMKNTAMGESSSEICCEMGHYYLAINDYHEAALWYYNAAFETESECDIRCHGDIPLYGLSRCYEQLGNSELAKEYEETAKKWKRPEK